VVFLASGLWHGAKWTFVTWGFLHALGLIAHHRWDKFYKGLCRKDRKWVARRNSAAYGLMAWAATQLFFVLTLIPFRAPTFGEAGAYARALVVPHAGLRLDLKNGPQMFQLNLLACVLFLLIYHLLEIGRGRSLREWFFRLPSPARGVVYGLVVVFLLLFVPLSRGSFIYAQF